jgi:hypothetical protein
MKATPAFRIAVRALLLAGAGIVTYLLLSLSDGPVQADGGGPGAITAGDPDGAPRQIADRPSHAVTALDTPLGALAASHPSIGAVQATVAGIVEAVLELVRATTGDLLRPAAPAPSPARPAPAAPPERAPGPAPAPVPSAPATAPRAAAAQVREAAEREEGPRTRTAGKPSRRVATAAGAAARGGAAPMPDPRSGGCVPSGCAHITDAIAGAGHPLMLTPPRALRPETRGRPVAPVAGLPAAGRRPAVTPLPG